MNFRYLLTLSLLITNCQFIQASEVLNNNQMINFKNEINKVINELENSNNQEITNNNIDTTSNNKSDIDKYIKNKEMIEEFKKFANDKELLKEARADNLNEFIKKRNYNDKLQYLRDFKNVTNELKSFRKNMTNNSNINNEDEELEEEININNFNTINNINENEINSENEKNIDEKETNNKSLKKNSNIVYTLSDLEKDLGMKESFKALNNQLLGTNVIQEMYLIAEKVYDILSDTNNLNIIINSNASNEVYNNIIEVIDNIYNKLWKICRIPLGCRKIIATHFIPCLEMDFDIIDYCQEKYNNRAYFRNRFKTHADFMINKDQNLFNEAKTKARNACSFIAGNSRKVNGIKEECLSKVRHMLIDINIDCLNYFKIDHNFFNYKWHDEFRKNANAICKELLTRIIDNKRNQMDSMSNFIINILLDSNNLQTILDSNDKDLFYTIQDIFEKFSNIGVDDIVYSELVDKIIKILLSDTLYNHGKATLFNDEKEEYNNLTDYCYNKIVEASKKVEQAFNKIVESSKSILDKNAFENPIKYINKFFSNELENMKKDPMAYCLKIQKYQSQSFIECIGNRQRVYHV